MLLTRLRWLIAAVSLLAMLATTMLAGPALTTAMADSNRPQTYLSLGDSVAFGYSPLLDHSNANNFIGYPSPAAATLKLTLFNAACSGETSSHFIDINGSDHGCGFYRAHFPLHVTYSSATETQLEFTDAFLQNNPKTLVVSINIGANDLFVLQEDCHFNISCIEAGLPGVLATLSANLDTIYGHIRNVDGYTHKLVALIYYSLNYSDPVGTNIISLLNQVVAARTLAYKGIVADGFGAFKAASNAFGGNSCAAGLLIVLSTSPLSCDVHPSPAGRDLLGQAIVSALR